MAPIYRRQVISLLGFGNPACYCGNRLPLGEFMEDCATIADI